jgi:hypothetical protein
LNTIRLEGAVDITSSAQLKTALVEAIKNGGSLHFSLDNVTCLDVTAIQLLWAAERAARSAGMPVEVDGRLPRELLDNLAALGFSGFPLI